MTTITWAAHGRVDGEWLEHVVAVLREVEAQAIRSATGDGDAVIENVATSFALGDARRDLEAGAPPYIAVSYSVERHAGARRADAHADSTSLTSLFDPTPARFRIRFICPFARISAVLDGNQDYVECTVEGSAASAEPTSTVLEAIPVPSADYIYTDLASSETSEVDSAIAPTTRRVFLAHGGDSQWVAVRRLLENSGYDVEVFEAEERAGESTLDAVVGMIRRSGVAIVMLTAADELTDGSRQGRQNVIHELGLAQGMLSKANVIVVLENGTSYPSNIDGHIQIRYNRGELHEVESRILRAVELRVTGSDVS